MSCLLEGQGHLGDDLQEGHHQGEDREIVTEIEGQGQERIETGAGPQGDVVQVPDVDLHPLDIDIHHPDVSIHVHLDAEERRVWREDGHHHQLKRNQQG